MFHELNCVDACLFPPKEDVILAVKEEWGLNEDESVTKLPLVDIKEVIRGRRNKRGGYVREALKQWEKDNSHIDLTTYGM